MWKIGLLRADQALEGPLDEVLAALAEDLDGDARRGCALLDQLAREVELDLARRGKADLDLLEAHAEEEVEVLELLVDAHGLDEGLVAVAEVDRAPDGRPFDAPVGPGARERGRGWGRDCTSPSLPPVPSIRPAAGKKKPACRERQRAFIGG